MSVEGNSFLKHRRLDQFVAGMLSGGTSTLILHPLDLVKTQFQVNTAARAEMLAKPYLYTFRYLKELYVRFGVRRGLYQGLSANLAGSTASWGLYFYLYDWMKAFSSVNDGNGKISTSNYFLASSAASALTVLCTNPLWVTKTRLCMQVPGAQGNYRGLFDALTRIGREEGLKGLYRGLIPGMFGITHGAIQFMVYEELKNWNKDRKASGSHSTLEYLLMSSTSKTIAMLMTYPYQVIRSRLQVRAFGGLVDVIWGTARNEGFWAFYRGIIPSTIRVMPGTCITFLVYEKVSEMLR